MLHKLQTKAPRLAVIAALSAATIMIAAPAASADTSASTANAVNVTLGGINLATSGTEQASNPGGVATDVAGATPAVSVLGAESTLVTAGVLQQTAVATGTGTSSACAGLLGNGATIQVGSNGICGLSTTSGESGGVTVGSLGSVVNATAITETCSDSSTGTPTATADFVDASILGTAILPNPAANTSLLGLIDLNTQSVTDGVITATALSIPALGISIGTVTCGPDAVTGTSSVLPGRSIPIAIGTGAAALGIGLGLRLRRSRRAGSAPVA